MCTIAVLHRIHAGIPLIVAANRDEMYAREALPPRVLSESPRIVGGLDVESGGTWMGVTNRGFFVGISNQRTYVGPDRSLRSRGGVVMEALRLGTTARVAAHVDALDARRYNSFNLIYGDAAGVEVAYGRADAERVERHPLPPGLHVLANDRIGSPEMPRAARAASLLEAVLDVPWPTVVPRLHDILADHDKPPLESLPDPPAGARFGKELLRELQAICIHTPLYGTRSSTILALGDEHVVAYLFADGAPSDAPHVEVTSLLDDTPR